MISHVVFDFDGTLADSMELAIRLYNAFAQKRGYGILTSENLAELRTLRARGLHLAIVSTNSEESIRAILARHGLSDLVSAVHCSSRLFGKARLLRALMRRERLRPEQIVYVGDEHRDMEASREASVRVIAVTWGADAEQRLREAAPDALATRPEEIADLVKRWA